jgi:phosphatidylethanolamine/phosphatidyl-N-methylethanolamine N-methyltransferase
MNEPGAGRPISQATLPTGNFNNGQLRQRFEFLRGFVRHPAQVGSIVPSSHRLEQRLVRSAGIAEARSVVEFGPGTGGTTAALLKAMAPAAQLLAIELDSDFHQLLGNTIDDPRFKLEMGSAEHLIHYLAARRMPAPDAIVSGIPFSTMPPEVSARVAAAVTQVLRPGGRFVAYQVRAHVARFISPHLGPPQQSWEMFNVPPVRVFTWVKGES